MLRSVVLHTGMGWDVRLEKAKGCHSLYQPWVCPAVGWDGVGTGECLCLLSLHAEQGQWCWEPRCH